MKGMLVLAVTLAAGSVQAAGPLLFWNTSSREFTGVYLALHGTGQWGPNEAANDPDGAVAADERLKLPDATPGRYDVRLVDKAGSTCVVKDVELRGTGPYAFAIGEPDLKTCHANAVDSASALRAKHRR